MADITITNLRIAPGHGARVPTKLRAYPRSTFLLNDANHTAVTESSPYNAGPHFREWTLTLNATDYYVPGDLALPATTDSPDHPNDARWGLFVFDANSRMMFPVAGLESFRLDAASGSQNAEDIVAYNAGGLPSVAERDVHITGDLQVDEDITASGNFIGNGSLLTGVHSAGVGGNSSTGSLSLIADSDDNEPNAIVDLIVGTVSTLRARRTYLQALVPFQPLTNEYANVKAYGAKGDGKDVVGGSMNSGSPTLTMSTAQFVAADVGKTIVVAGAGAAGVTLLTTINAFISTTQVTLAANAATTIANRLVTWGTDDTTAIQNAISALMAVTITGVGGGVVYFPQGLYLTNQITIPQWVRLTGTGALSSRLGNLSNSNYVINAGPDIASPTVLPTSLRYGIGVENLGVLLLREGGHGITLVSTSGAIVRNSYIENGAGANTSQALFIDGGDNSNLFSYLETVICNHVKFGLRIGTTGSQNVTSVETHNLDVFGDSVAGSIGVKVDAGNGNGSRFFGGNFEQLDTGTQINGQSCLFFGPRFESNVTQDVLFDTFAYGNLVIGATDLSVVNDISGAGFNSNRIEASVKPDRSPFTDSCVGREVRYAFGAADVIVRRVGFPGQTGNLAQYENSSGTVLAAILAGGGIKATLPNYADNAAAITGGLTAGMFYRSGDAINIVH